MTDGFKNLMPLFLSESERIFGEMRAACEALGDNPDDGESRKLLCRGAHTVKGSAAVMGLSEVSDFCRVIEQLMGCFTEAPRPYDRCVREAVELAQQLVQETAQGEAAEPIADRARMAELTRISDT